MNCVYEFCTLALWSSSDGFISIHEENSGETRLGCGAGLFPGGQLLQSPATIRRRIAAAETAALLSVEILETGKFLFCKQQSMDFRKKHGKVETGHFADGTMEKISGEVLPFLKGKSNG